MKAVPDRKRQNKSCPSKVSYLSWFARKVSPGPFSLSNEALCESPAVITVVLEVFNSRILEGRSYTCWIPLRHAACRGESRPRKVHEHRKSFEGHHTLRFVVHFICHQRWLPVVRIPLFIHATVRSWRWRTLIGFGAFVAPIMADNFSGDYWWSARRKIARTQKTEVVKDKRQTSLYNTK